MPDVIYKCSKCKITCKSYHEAERCEQSHLSPVSIKAEAYRIGPYPFRVVLSFPDGQEREYETIEGRL